MGSWGVLALAVPSIALAVCARAYTRFAEYRGWPIESVYRGGFPADLGLVCLLTVVVSLAFLVKLYWLAIVFPTGLLLGLLLIRTFGPWTQMMALIGAPLGAAGISVWAILA